MHGSFRFGCIDHFSVAAACYSNAFFFSPLRNLSNSKMMFCLFSLSDVKSCHGQCQNGGTCKVTFRNTKTHRRHCRIHTCGNKRWSWNKTGPFVDHHTAEEDVLKGVMVLKYWLQLVLPGRLFFSF